MKMRTKIFSSILSMFLIMVLSGCSGGGGGGSPTGGGNTGVDTTGGAVCGNKTCETGETVATCPQDCAVCGNNICETGETAESCSKDCCVQNTSDPYQCLRDAAVGEIKCSADNQYCCYKRCTDTSLDVFCGAKDPQVIWDGLLGTKPACQTLHLGSSFSTYDCFIDTQGGHSYFDNNNELNLYIACFCGRSGNQYTSAMALWGGMGWTGCNQTLDITLTTTIQHLQACDRPCVPCTPNCSGKQCGDNGCGGSCGSCSGGLSCKSGQCVNACDECLHSCHGMSSCCTGCNCMCEDECGGCFEKHRE